MAALNLDKRQLVLFGVLGVVLLFAVWDLGVSNLLSGDKNSDKSAVDYSSTAANILNKANAEKMNSKQVYESVLIAAPMPVLPFYSKDTAFYFTQAGDGAVSTTVDGTEVVYSGFVEIGRSKLAILNGIEYEEGDPFEVAGVIVKEISRNFVLLIKEADDEGRTYSVRVPLVSDEVEDPLKVRTVK